MRTFKEAFGDSETMKKHGFGTKNTITGSQVKKSLDGLKKSVDTYYDIAEKMISAQVDTLKSNYQTYEKYPELQNLDKVKKLRKYISEKEKDLNILRNVVRNHVSNSMKATDFSLDGSKDTVDVESLEQILKRPIHNAAKVVASIEKSAEADVKSVQPQATPISSSSLIPPAPVVPPTTPVSSSSVSQQISSSSSVVAPEVSSSSSVITPEISSSSITQASSSSIETVVPTPEPSSSSVVASTPEVSSSSIVAPVATPEVAPVAQTSSPKDIKTIKQDSNIQDAISKIIDGFNGSAIAPIKETLLTEAKWSEILSDANIEKLKKKTLNSKEMETLLKDIRKHITANGYIIGKGRMSNDILPNVQIEPTPPTTPEVVNTNNIPTPVEDTKDTTKEIPVSSSSIVVPQSPSTPIENDLITKIKNALPNINGDEVIDGIYNVKLMMDYIIKHKDSTNDKDLNTYKERISKYLDSNPLVSSSSNDIVTPEPVVPNTPSVDTISSSSTIISAPVTSATPEVSSSSAITPSILSDTEKQSLYNSKMFKETLNPNYDNYKSAVQSLNKGFVKSNPEYKSKYEKEKNQAINNMKILSNQIPELKGKDINQIISILDEYKKSI